MTSLTWGVLWVNGRLTAAFRLPPFDRGSFGRRTGCADLTCRLLCGHAQGDSGGPMTVTEGGVTTLIGVTSYGVPPCAVSGFAAGFTRVSGESSRGLGPRNSEVSLSQALADPWGDIRAATPPPPKTQSCQFAPSPKTAIGVNFVTASDDFYRFYMSAATSNWRCRKGLFWRFFKLKVSKFSSESQNLPEIGCLRIQNRYKINFHTLFPRRHRGVDATPLGFSENNSRTDRPILTKLGIPNHWTILHLPLNFQVCTYYDLWPVTLFPRSCQTKFAFRTVSTPETCELWYVCW